MYIVQHSMKCPKTIYYILECLDKTWILIGFQRKNFSRETDQKFKKAKILAFFLFTEFEKNIITIRNVNVLSKYFELLGFLNIAPSLHFFLSCTECD